MIKIGDYLHPDGRFLQAQSHIIVAVKKVAQNPAVSASYMWLRN